MLVDASGAPEGGRSAYHLLGRTEPVSESDRADRLDRSAVLERVSDAVVSLDTDFRFTYANDRAEHLLGRDAEELVGESVWELFPDAAESVASETFEEAMETQRETCYERYNEQCERWFEVRVYPDPDGLSLFFRDVDERKERERRLERYERIVESLPVAVGESVPEDGGQFTYVNDRMVEMFDADSKGDLKRRGASEIYAIPSEREALQGKLDAEGAVDGEEVKFETFDGDRFVGSTTVTTEEVDGRTYRVGVVEDVTDRQERIRRLERAETMFQNTQDALFLVDVEEGGETFRLERVNPAYERLTGLSNEDLAGRTIRSVFGEDDGENIRSRYCECLERGEPIEYEERLSVPEPGSYWETRVAPVTVGGEVVQLVGATRNVTERREREQELRETTRTLEAMIENSPDAVLMIDEDHEVTLWNRAAEEMFGWTSEEVLGERLPFVPEEKTDEFERFLEDLDAGETKRGIDTVRQRKDGDRVDVSLSSTKVTVDGTLVGYMATYEDVGERLEYERRLERQRDDLELLTQMTSHDIRNDLEVVLGYAELLRDSVDAEARTYAEEVLTNARDAVDLTQSARDLAAAMRRTDHELEPIPLRSALQSQLEQVRATYSTASVTVDGEVPAVRVLADERLSSVFRNLLKNAIQHSDEPVPEVRVAAEADGDTVTVHVADNGPGISDERKAAVFGRGEKGLKSEGTGIGLYLVDTLVEGYGGTVRLHDNDPKGAVFSVELDRA